MDSQRHERRPGRPRRPAGRQPAPRGDGAGDPRPHGSTRREPRNRHSGRPAQGPRDAAGATGTSRARAGGSARAIHSPPQRDPQVEQPTRVWDRGAFEEAPAAPPRVGSRREAQGHIGAPPVDEKLQAPPLRRPASRTPHARSRAPRPLRLGATLLVLLLVLGLGWGLGLGFWADSRIEHVDALSEAADTPGTTYLIAGSDRREGAAVAADGTEGARADTMMLLHRAPNGTSYLVSLPRDTLVDIPGHGGYKLNAAYAFGGPALLVQTVEEFTGLTIDHYVEIGFDGVTEIVDAVGHVNLCIDRDVDDERSGLKMTEGCHDVGGDQALAFVRARYFDPTADLGRQQRQQQFVGALTDRAASPSVLLNPIAQVRLAGAGGNALTTSEGTGIIDVGRMALSLRSAMGAEHPAVMPIENPEYQTRHSGVAILTDDQEIAQFFGAIGDGSYEPPAQPPAG